MMIARGLIALVALIHVYILVLEMFLWRTRARKIFRTTQEFADSTAVLAANQGLYNGFLAAGLIWALVHDLDLAPFFLICVAVAGVYGGITANRRIIYVQAIPAVIALLALYLRL
jgi:putative membrane protein